MAREKLRYKDQQDERKYNVTLFKIEKYSSLAHSLGGSIIKWGSLGFIAYILAPGLTALAGKSTEISIPWIATFLEKFFSFDDIISKGLAGVSIMSIIWARFERKLRQKNIERFGKEKAELEKQINPKRQSSMISPKGLSRSEDY